MTPSGTDPTDTSPSRRSAWLLIRDLVHDRTGIYFDDEAVPAMADKLSGRVTEHSSLSLLEYYYLLKETADTAVEWHEVLNAFSVPETYFWREIDQVQNLVTQIVPEWFARRSDPLTIWSAGCASGEEPFSIAIALDVAGWGHHPIRIQASDASDKALQKASLAVYRERALRMLPDDLRRRYFIQQDDGWKLLPDIVTRVQFQWINLMSDEDVLKVFGPEVIFCRNVFIYFSPISVAKVVRGFARCLPLGGHLFIGATESLVKVSDEFELCDLGNSFVYRRTRKSL